MTSNTVWRRGSRRASHVLTLAVVVVLLTSCGGSSADPPAHEGDLYRVDGETAHMQCQGAGSPTVVLLGGQGATTSTWSDFRTALGPDVRTCAWDYPGVGHSTGAPMMTAGRAASSLDGTLRAANVPRPVMLVGHSVAGLTTRLYVGQHPADVAGVVLFDPTVASFARMFDDKEFRPGWDGTASADQVEQVTTWPEIPFEILRHDPTVYATAKVWSNTVEAQWGADQDAFATLTPNGIVRVAKGSGHDIYQDAQSDSVAAVQRVLGAVVTKAGLARERSSSPHEGAGDPQLVDIGTTPELCRTGQTLQDQQQATVPSCLSRNKQGMTARAVGVGFLAGRVVYTIGSAALDRHS
jgi:pimeloyl-ACP methyl ester carboxylesterase